MLYALPWLLPTLSDFSKKNAYTNREVQCIAVRWSMLQCVAFLGVPCLELSNKPRETTLAVKDFDAVIPFMTQIETNHQILSETVKIRDMALKAITDFDTLGTL